MKGNIMPKNDVYKGLSNNNYKNITSLGPKI